MRLESKPYEAGAHGLGVDALSGAINKYEPEATIEMRPIKGCRARA